MLTRLAAVAVACALLAACGSGRGQECSANRDCPSSQLCVAGHCVNSGCGALSEPCATDNDCGLGQSCSRGCCVRTSGGGCQNDEGCAATPSTSHCNTATGACVQCLQARDCGAGKLCKGNTCQAQPGCSRDADCTNAALPVCDLSQRACVQCLQGSDCHDPATPICDSSHHCVAPTVCQSDANCQKPTPVCQQSSGNCVQCLRDTDCPSTSLCSPQLTCVLRGNTTCTSDADCAGNASTPKCKAGANGQPGTCVACTDSSQCPSGSLCSADNCVVPSCNGDPDCPASLPHCFLDKKVCVACTLDAHCPAGSVCVEQQCKVATKACTTDNECVTADPSKPYCKVVAGGTNVCVQCKEDANCGAGQVCTNNQCQTKTCTGDQDCSGTTPHCKTTVTPAVCVACTSDTHCGTGYKCTATNTCKPVCTVATQAQDCASPTPVCKESPSGNACVACVKDADCGDATKICSSSNTCIPKPPACDSPPACTTNGNCCPSGTVCKTTVSPRQCVQCLANTDCTNGYLCDTATNTCKPPPVGAEGQACKADYTCNAGLICIDEGGAWPVCRTLCDPYSATNTCTAVGATRVCEWLGFNEADKLFGFCALPNGKGAAGAACDPRLVDGCEWNLFCRPTGAATGVCTRLCDPNTASTCGGTDVCNKPVGAVSFNTGTNLAMGYCGPSSKWGIACARDAPPSGTNPDCGTAITSGMSASSLFCAPSTLPGENPAINVLGTCQFKPAASTAKGGAASDCTTFGNDACRTGACLANGSATCFAGCNFNADCQRDQNSYPCTSGACFSANPTYCMDISFSTSYGTSKVPACVPQCRNESDCAAVGGSSFGRTCVAQANHGGDAWRSYCAPAAGLGRAGAKCASGSDCESGTCFSASTLQAIELGLTVTGFTATDGFCLGSCLPPNSDVCTASNDGTSCVTADTRAGLCNGGICKARCGGTYPACTIGDSCVNGLCNMNECGATNGMFCNDVAALPLKPANTGNLGVTGYAQYGVCFGAGCAHDADCSGFSKDANNPRVCAPYKQTYTSSTDRNASCTTANEATSCAGISYTGLCNTAANNPNPGQYPNGYGIYGQNGRCRSTIFALHCAPSLGQAKKGGGAACAKGSECRTGHCVVLPDNVPIEAKAGATAGICFAACTANTDCVAGTCKASAYLGIPGLKSCQP